MQIIDRGSAVTILRALAPDAIWLLKHIESADGYVQFPVPFVNGIKRLNIGNYPALYEDERRIGAMLIRAFLEPDEWKALGDELSDMSPAALGEFAADALRQLDVAADSLQLPRTPAQKRTAERAFAALSESEKADSVMFWRRFMMGFLAAFHQILSVMVHGEKLTAW